MEIVTTAGYEKEWRRRNRMLNTLESATRWRISPHLQSVMCERGAVVCEPGIAPEFAYFPVSSVLSLQTVLANGSAIETANIGSEGALGLSAVLSSRMPSNRGVVRLEGALIRCPLDALQNELADKIVRNLCAVNSESILMQVQQNMVCNARHDTTARLCRWLLTVHDRAAGDSVAYPQEFLAEILDETYESVALVAQSMEADGLVSYQRGTVRIVDRPGLEHASCECYAIVKKRYEDLLYSQ
jgi:CRP-like cAMP-binding protein